MLGLHRRIFNDQPQDTNHLSSSSSSSDSYNKKVLKSLILYSPLSCLMMLIVLLMFLVCQITDIVNGKYNLSVIKAETLLKYGANSNLLVNQGQIWRLFTAMFLHAGILHLFANSTSFFMYLMPVQKKTRSKILYACVLFIGGMLGNILSDNVFNMKNGNLLAVGSSTSICSVIGFDFAYRILRVDGQPLQTRRLAITLIYLLLISIMPGVDFYGHFGSLIGGFLIGLSVLKGNEEYWSKKKNKVLKLGGIIGLSVYICVNFAILIKYQQD